MRIDRFEMTRVPARQHCIVDSVTAFVTPQEELTGHMPGDPRAPEDASSGFLAGRGRRPGFPRPEQPEDLVRQHEEITIEERDDRSEDGWHAQVFQRVDDIGEARRRHQQDRHLHRKPGTDEDADETQESHIGDSEIPHEKVESGEWLSRYRKQNRDGDQRERQCDQRTFECEGHAKVRKQVGKQQEKPRKPKGDPRAIGQKRVRKNERHRHRHFHPRVEAMDETFRFVITIKGVEMNDSIYTF